MGDRSFIGNRIRNYNDEVQEAKQKAHNVMIKTKTSVRKSKRG